MNDRVPRSRAHTRNPIVQSLALAVLGIALVVAIVMGALVFAVLLGALAVGYLVALAYTWLRLFRLRRRAAPVIARPPVPAPAFYGDGEYQIVEAAVDTAPRGLGGPA